LQKFILKILPRFISKKIEQINFSFATTRLFIDRIFFDISATRTDFESFVSDLSLTKGFIEISKLNKIKRIKNTVKGAARKGTARLALTKTNNQNKRIENGLTAFLEKKARAFIEIDIPIHELNERFGEEIMQKIQEHAARSYYLGFSYVERATGKNLELRANDSEKIKNISREAFTNFWNTVRRGREEKIEKENEKIKGASAFDFIKMLSVILSTDSLNAGTVEAAHQVEKEPLWEFVTMRDDRVDCRICAPLDGLRFRESDPEFVEPKLHIGCRCRLLLVINGETISK
jgi:SPP1 gp7 family putative phage head morphogenesis protein